MALFPALLRLASERRGCTEDFFTEVAAEILRRHPRVLWHWLLLTAQGWKPYDPGADVLQVRTQVRRRRLDGHHSASIIDLVVRRRNAGEDASPDVVYVESKVDSGEGDQQLHRYAGHLEREEARRRLLVYATRDAVPDDALPKGLNSPIVHARWGAFYRALVLFPDCPLVSETRLLMEHLRMDHSRTFTPQDLLVANEARSTFRKLDESIAEARQSHAFQRVNGMSKSNGIAHNQLLDHGRYGSVVRTVGGLFGAAADAWMLLFVGFVLDRPDGVPRATVFVETPGEWGSEDRGRSVERFRAFAEQHGAHRWDVQNDGSRYVQIARSLPLSGLVGEADEEDGLDSVVRFFKESLEDVAMEHTG